MRFDSGAVRCWGSNEFGQLGYGHTEDLGDDEPATSLGSIDLGAKATAVSTGVAHSCALLEDGSVRCWGRNVYGQLGTLSTDSIGDDELPGDSVSVDVGGPVTRIAAGGEHTCALLTTGGVRCWGLGVSGQLGYASTQNIGADVRPAEVGDVPLGERAIDIAAGRDHTCALLASGAVRCWGRGKYGALGYGSIANIGDDETPLDVSAVPLGARAVQVTAGWYHTCARLETGSVRCWGYGGLGELGYASTTTLGDDEPASSGGDVPLGGSALDLSAGLHHSCAVLTTGAVRCWGYGLSGRLGYGNVQNIGDDESPASAGDVSLGARATVVRAGAAHTCALLETSAVRCWGDGARGQLGGGSPGAVGDNESPRSSPPAVQGFDPCEQGAAHCSPDASCESSGATYTCTCRPGFIGDGSSCIADPGIFSVAAGAEHTCALTTSGAVRCWGMSASGRLGYPGTTNIGDNETPASAGNVDVGGRATELALGEAHTCALLEQGNVRCWGLGSSGQLGYGNTRTIGDDESPASAGDVPLGAKALHLAAGRSHTCALVEGGGVRCWGLGKYGRLGYGNAQNLGDNETPASVGDVPLGAAAQAIAAGDEHTCALLTTGAVRCWGNGAVGQLGYGDPSKRVVGDDEPASAGGDVPLGDAVSKLSAGGTRTCAITTQGTLRCWGYGLYGALGYGSTDTLGDDEPAGSGGDVPLGGKCAEVDVGWNHACARLENGSVRCWGYGGYGALGYGNKVTLGDNEVPSGVAPVPLAGTAIALALGANHSCALVEGGVSCWGLATSGRLGYANTLNVGDDETPVSVGFVRVH